MRTEIIEFYGAGAKTRLVTFMEFYEARHLTIIVTLVGHCASGSQDEKQAMNLLIIMLTNQKNNALSFTINFGT